MFKKGERINLSCAPSVWLDQYKALKPHASITVELTGDTAEENEAQIVEAQSKLGTLLKYSLVTEIDFVEGASSILNETPTLEALKQWASDELEKQINHVPTYVKAVDAVEPVQAGVVAHGTSAEAAKTGVKATPLASLINKSVGKVQKPGGVPLAKQALKAASKTTLF